MPSVRWAKALKAARAAPPPLKGKTTAGGRAHTHTDALPSDSPSLPGSLPVRSEVAALRGGFTVGAHRCDRRSTVAPRKHAGTPIRQTPSLGSLPVSPSSRKLVSVRNVGADALKNRAIWRMKGYAKVWAHKTIAARSRNKVLSSGEHRSREKAQKLTGEETPHISDPVEEMVRLNNGVGGGGGGGGGGGSSSKRRLMGTGVWSPDAHAYV